MATWMMVLVGVAMAVIALEFIMVFRNRRDMQIWAKLSKENGNEE